MARIHELPSTSIPTRPRPVDNLFLKRGNELFNQGDYNNAVFLYGEALRQDTDNASLYLQLALARMMCSPPQLDQALHDVNSAIQLSPSNGHAWKLKGDIYLRKQEYRAAEEVLEQATNILQGYDKVQAIHSLADARTRASTQPPAASIPRTTTQSVSVHPPQPELAANRPTINVDSSQSNPPAAETETRPLPPAPLTPQAPTAGTASLSPYPSQPPRPATPNMITQSEALAQQLDIPTEAPPSYSAASRPVTGSTMGGPTASQTLDFQTTITAKRQGSLYLRPLTTEGQIDTIQLLFFGRTYIQSILLDLPPHTAVHPAWKNYFVDAISHPGTNFVDYDCESTSSYDGYHLGTTSVLGYAEEYREYQLTLKLQLQLSLEAQTIPPPMALDAIVERIQLLQRSPTLEDNVKLDQILGLVPAFNATTRTAISDICMSFHRAQYTAPNRFIDFLTSGSFSVHLFGTTGIGLTNFLFHILLGAELAIRLTKMGAGQKYPNIMKTTTSALVFIARQWMQNVTIRRSLTSKYALVATNHATQSDGLLRFAEALGWPYMHEARENIEDLYTKLTSNPANVADYLKDWLYGLVLPGKFFRHRILSCLVLACPTTKHLGYAPHYDAGLIVGNKSYWPKRTVLGRVLGGLRNPKSTCGWIGPVPCPTGCQSSWILLHARRVNFVTPVVDDMTQTNLELLGFSESEADIDPIGLTREISDMNKWNPPTSLPARAGASTSAVSNDTSAVRLTAVRLNEVESTVSVARQYRAAVDFMCNGEQVTFTLYSNPVFVHVPKCAGTSHPIHERLVKKMFTGVVLAKDLNNGANIPSTEVLTIIDATEPGEEALARAWCAQSGRHAVVRKNGIGCFTCATNLATKRTGLGFNVLIWC
ncbi:uncharacterized protein Z518_02830 [Rhinocladiella mackenziei CBS 650.93]|uniref:Uncharacterized protein n=1 Tax=Rhinocladiella mackenziei CBS 650.93 TaxID=1442369 RepID=A0A0D2IQG3_9EURO|nr:uncharacterized protein Z518_02830 [Rhinocladiella mackenziei CBS 650.93]KIX08174.1 hypothetical protein Z518_02830 [Rhinocladiella mackenziei CBS 650.93]